MLFQRLTKVAVRPLLAHQSARGIALKDISNQVIAFKDKPGVKAFAKAALVELTPPTPAELPQAFRDGFRLFTKSNWRNVTVREACVNAAVTIEVLCWFFVGEIIGKGTIIGYQV